MRPLFPCAEQWQEKSIVRRATKKKTNNKTNGKSYEGPALLWLASQLASQPAFLLRPDENTNIHFEFDSKIALMGLQLPHISSSTGDSEGGAPHTTLIKIVRLRDFDAARMAENVRVASH